MKKILLLLIILTTITTVGQNTFPSDGNVGVGTALPAYKLDLIGSLGIGSQSVNANTTKIFLRNPAGKTWAISSGANMITESSFSIYNWIDNQSAPFFHISTNGNVGIGTSTPDVKLDVKGTIKSYETTPLGASINSFQLINERGGSVGENKMMNRFWFLRDENLNTWYSARLHDGISVDFSFGIPHVDTRTWWERNPSDNIQSWGNAGDTYLIINAGNVGIGSINPDSKLTVKGKIHAEEVKIDLAVPADYVFQKYYTGKSELKPDYTLLTLPEIEKFAQANHHLPNVPSAKEIKENGLHLGEMSNILLQKIEELTLYVIEIKKENENMKKENDLMKIHPLELTKQIKNFENK
nr:hypothetical protein [uncultured Flavobacterium sp.]